MRRAAGLVGLLGLAVVALAVRVLAAPRPLGFPLDTGGEAILGLRVRIALAGAVTAVGLGLAAVAAQARAREAALDATLAGPAWGALPAALLPAPLAVKVLAGVAGAWIVARLAGAGEGGLPTVLARGVAVAGAVVSLAALGLFLGPGLTPTTATAFLHASLGGTLPRAGWDVILVAGVLGLGALVLALARWRELLLARTGLAPAGWATTGVTVLGSTGAVLVAGVVPGLGLLAARLARPLVGEHPRWFVPGTVLASVGVLGVLDAGGQALAWPGELPVGLLTAVLASALLVWRVAPHDRV